jgi:hypothetical protein
MSLKFLFLSLSCVTHVAASTAVASREPECSLYLAPSFTPGIGRGVFAGTSFRSGEEIDNSLTLAVSQKDIDYWQLGNYVWFTDESGISMAEFGLGMLFNHRNPATVRHVWPKLVTMTREQKLAHTTYSTVVNAASRDIAVGEELFVSYCDDTSWFDHRGITLNDTDENDVPLTRSLTELKEVGVCLTDVKVRYNNHS